MIRLEKSEYNNVASLFEGIEHSIPLVFAVIEQKSGGKIFVDDRTNPKSAFIQQDGGFMYLLSEEDKFIEQVSECIINELLPEMDEQEMVVFSFGDNARNKLYELFKEKGAIIIERKMFRFNLEKFTEIEMSIKEVPSEFNIKSMEKSELQDYCKDRKLGSSIDGKLGYRVMKNDEVVSECVSIFVGAEQAEIDINTNENYRGKGLGKACAIAFIRGCVNHNIVPNWSCWPFREESITLAKKLGFEEVQDVQVNFWAENM